MKTRVSRSLRHAALALALTAATGIASAQVFGPPDTGFKGSIRPTTQNVLPGSEIGFQGSGFKPGQKVTLLRGATVLNALPYVADAEGKFSGKLTIPADAIPGRHPIIVRAEGPDAATVLTLKISKEIPLSGAGRFDVASQPVTRGLYQSAYSTRENALFVTSAIGRPPVKESELLKVDADSLAILARIVPAKVPGRDDDHVYAVYGVAVDEANGNVWVTNTRDDTVAVYSAKDLKLVKQFDKGVLPHGRDVIVDSRRGRVYASAVGEPKIAVFDAKTLQPLEPIAIQSRVRGEKFSPMSLALDEATGRLYTASISTPEAVVIDGPAGRVEKVIALSNATSASGVAWDSDARRLLIASQGSDNLLIVDAESGQAVHDVYVGNNPLNVVYDSKAKLAFVANRNAGTVTAVDASGRIVANLGGGSVPNHLHPDGRGNIYLVSKRSGPEDTDGDRLIRFTPKR